MSSLLLSPSSPRSHISIAVSPPRSPTPGVLNDTSRLIRPPEQGNQTTYSTFFQHPQAQQEAVGLNAPTEALLPNENQVGRPAFTRRNFATLIAGLSFIVGGVVAQMHADDYRHANGTDSNGETTLDSMGYVLGVGGVSGVVVGTAALISTIPAISRWWHHRYHG